MTIQYLKEVSFSHEVQTVVGYHHNIIISSHLLASMQCAQLELCYNIIVANIRVLKRDPTWLPYNITDAMGFSRKFLFNSEM